MPRLNSTSEVNKRKNFITWITALGLGIICLAFLSVWLIARIEGSPPLKLTQTTTIYDDKNQKVAEATFNNQKRYWVKIDNIAPSLINATIAIEDKRFYQHHGFDFKRMLGAAITDIKSMSKNQGASTITMQYARNIYLSHDKTWERKLIEAFYTIRLEMNYSKKEILQGYLNTIYYGSGNYGIEAASRYYFGKSAKDLSLAEASMLAGIPKGPTYYSPLNNYKRARARQKIILNNMVKDDMISKKEAQEAFATKLTFQENHENTKKVAPYFQDAVTDILTHKLGLDSKQVALGGYKVYTTLDNDLQKKAEKWLFETIKDNSKIQSALVAMNPQTGAVKALVGGRDYQQSTFNRAIQAKRTPGSSFKPFLYYEALKEGFTPSTQLRSEPTTFTYNNGRSTYSPSNYGGYYADGPITLAQALALSDNIYAVKTNMFIGPDKLVKAAKEMGIKSPLSPIPSLALGTKPVSLLEMTNSYGTIADGGKRHEAFFIRKVVDRNGKTIYEWKPKAKQTLDHRYAFVLAHLMTGIFDESLDDYSRVTGASVDDILTHKVAGKSGTTTSDSWMLGFTPELSAGVWVGYDNGEPISTYPDSRYSKQIWAHFIEDALQGQPADSFTPPDGVVGVMVNPDSGLLASKDCPTSRWTYYVKGTEPRSYCGSNTNNDKRNEAPKNQKDQKDSKNKSFFERIKEWFS